MDKILISHDHNYYVLEKPLHIDYICKDCSQKKEYEVCNEEECHLKTYLI